VFCKDILEYSSNRTDSIPITRLFIHAKLAICYYFMDTKGLIWQVHKLHDNLLSFLMQKFLIAQ
jgi:hypothetical protein